MFFLLRAQNSLSEMHQRFNELYSIRFASSQPSLHTVTLRACAYIGASVRHGVTLSHCAGLTRLPRCVRAGVHAPPGSRRAYTHARTGARTHASVLVAASVV